MNENVTIKTPKRRRWIARLLISALCILLASSLLFVGVIADVVFLTPAASFTVFPGTSTSMICIIDYDVFAFSVDHSVYLYRDDFLLDTLSFDSIPGFIEPSAVAYSLYFDPVRSALYCLQYYEYTLRIIKIFYRDYSFTSSSFASYSISTSDFLYSGYAQLPFVAYDGHLYGFLYHSANKGVAFFHFHNGDLDIGSTNYLVETGGNILARAGSLFLNGYCYFPFIGLVTDTSGNWLANIPLHPFFSVDGMACYANNNYIYSVDPLTGISDAVFEITGFPASGSLLGHSSGSVLTLFNYFTGATSSNPYSVAVFANAVVPPESSDDSSDETTVEPPPESSEESSAGGVIDLYSYDRLSDGTYESALIGTLDLTDATGLRVFLGMYLLGDNVWSDIKTPLTLLVYREDGSLDTYTYDYYAAGFAWGSGSPGSFTFPKFIGGYFDIPLTSSSELYFASSAPGGTIWLQNNSVVLRQINLLNSDSYVELENVSAEECIISVYDSPSDDDPESFVYTSGVLKYTLRKRNSSSSIPVSLDYGETGIVHGVMKYNGADFTVSSIILASDPDLMPPIYDFESMDNALSEAYDDVSRQQYLEDLLTSYIENAYGTVSYDPDTSGAFLGGVDLMGDIVDSSGGSTIISAFVNMWSIHPFFPAMVGLLGTFLIFSFFLRKA